MKQAPRETVCVELGTRSYDIVIGHGILDDVGASVGTVARGRQIGIVSDSTVWALHGERVAARLRDAGFEVVPAFVQPGEQHKNLDSIAAILDAFLDARFERSSTIVALGGGVVGDMAGFAASILLRGVQFVQVPTTIVSQVDASVGGKTGVDHRRGKNLIGAFHQPALVLIDTDTLSTLPDRDVLAGLAEVVKHAIIRDPHLFSELEKSLDAFARREAAPEDWVRLIARNCQIKAEVVSEDERESGLRAILNYGHTAGHAVESLGGYERYRHGEAILYGMRIAGAIAEKRGMWSEAERARHDSLIDRINREPAPTDMTPASVWDVMRSDKKAHSGAIRFVLPERIGEVKLVDDVTPEMFKAAWDAAIGSA